MQDTVDVKIGSVTATVSVELLTDHDSASSSAGYPKSTDGGQPDKTVFYTFRVTKYVSIPWLVMMVHDDLSMYSLIN